MNDSAYLVSIVVPTHNRSRYAIPCIRSLLEIESEALQIVVHDTSDDDCELAVWAGTQSDYRLTYVHLPERLSMTENHEQALALARGEYVCIIGDDDSVSKYIIAVAAFARARDIELLTPKIKAIYSWPDFKTKFYGSAHAGKLYLEQFAGELIGYDAHQSLELTLLQACQGTDCLPKLYHGLVKRTILDSLRAKYGRVFFGVSPDMSAAVLISLQGGTFYVIDFPFTLPGASHGSNTGRSAVNKHKGDIDNDPHMQPFKKVAWPEQLPRFFSVETVWAHAAWETLRGTNNDEWQKRFNFARLYALCFIRHREYRKFTSAALRLSRDMGIGGLTKVNLACELAKCLWFSAVSKAKRLQKPSPSNGREIVAIVEDVRLARQELDRRINDSVALRSIIGSLR
jgi:glycosyltransferase involved in cell wall biosynthesis